MYSQSVNEIEQVLFITISNYIININIYICACVCMRVQNHAQKEEVLVNIFVLVTHNHFL